jgi:hypothetical protein
MIFAVTGLALILSGAYLGAALYTGLEAWEDGMDRYPGWSRAQRTGDAVACALMWPLYWSARDK